MNNNKRFLFPFACVFVFLHPKSSRLSHHNISQQLFRRNYHTIVRCFPPFYSSPCLWNVTLIHFLREKKIQTKHTNNITRLLDAAASPPSCLPSRTHPNCHTTRRKTHPSAMRSKIKLKTVRVRRTLCTLHYCPTEESRPNSWNTGTRLKSRGRRAERDRERMTNQRETPARAAILSIAREHPESSAGWKICDRKGHHGQGDSNFESFTRYGLLFAAIFWKD